MRVRAVCQELRCARNPTASVAAISSEIKQLTRFTKKTDFTVASLAGRGLSETSKGCWVGGRDVFRTTPGGMERGIFKTVPITH